MYKMYFRVANTEIDSYSIVHHPEYIKWAENAFVEYMIEKGFNAPKYSIVNINAKYIKAARQYDKILVWIKKVREIDNVLKVNFDIMNSENSAVYCKLIIEFKME